MNIKQSVRTAGLRADCARCCGLCCVAPAFDAEQGFGFDKPAHTACRNLRTDHRCGIHGERGVRGFPACVSFDCYGAGQWVTQHLYGGRSWQTSPEIASGMFRLYGQYRALHELMALLDMAIRRARETEAAPLEECLCEIEGICEAGAVLAGTVNIGALSQRVRRLLQESVGGA